MTPSSQARRSDTLFDHDSNVLLSPALSATTVNSRPVSGIYLGGGISGGHNARDSINSIVNDPFFQKLRDVAARGDEHDDHNDGDDGDDDLDRRAPAWLEEAIHESKQRRTNSGRADAEVPGCEAGGRSFSTADSGFYEHGDAAPSLSSARYKRAPPRRESLIIGQPQASTGSPHPLRVRPFCFLSPFSLPRFRRVSVSPPSLPFPHSPPRPVGLVQEVCFDLARAPPRLMGGNPTGRRKEAKLSYAA